MLVETLDIGDRVMQPARRDQIRLFDVVEQEVILPMLVAKAFVTLGGLDHRCGRLPQQLEHRRLPQRGIVPPQIELGFGEPVRVRQQLGGQLQKSLGQAKLVGKQRRSHARLARHEVAQELGALIGGAGKRLGQCDRIVIRWFARRISSGHRMISPERLL